MPDISFSPESTQNGIPDAPFQAMAPEAQQRLRASSTSRSQRRIQEDVESLRRQLEASGMLKPATIINFNPVPLVQDGLIRQTVPAAGFSETGRVEWPHDGRTFVGHMMTIRTPVIYASTEGSETDPDTLSDQPQLKANYIPPIGIAYSFLEHYSLAAKDSAHMGGVLIFEGDRHTLTESHLDRSQRQIQVPDPILLPRNRRSFTVKLQSLDDVAAACFEQQAAYTDMRIQNAHSLWTTNDPMQQKQITDIDRLWAHYALSHEWIKDLPPWVHARITSGSALAAIVRCPACTKPRPVAGIFVCPDCRAPYDAFEAYMNGAPVSQMYLDMLPDEQLGLVAAEMVRRENRTKSALDKAKRDARTAKAETDGTV